MSLNLGAKWTNPADTTAVSYNLDVFVNNVKVKSFSVPVATVATQTAGLGSFTSGSAVKVELAGVDKHGQKGAVSTASFNIPNPPAAVTGLTIEIVP